MVIVVVLGYEVFDISRISTGKKIVLAALQALAALYRSSKGLLGQRVESQRSGMALCNFIGCFSEGSTLYYSTEAMRRETNIQMRFQRSQVRCEKICT